ncbi:MAG: hypothetical protein IJ682_06745 [Lachnospiraceae bacterium]|nr:hypothetical protein [Lachnospiraceae bacterium]
MLKPLVLDNEEYEDIFGEARSVAASRYPQWTDYNRHDPGITMLELFALRKEEQQYFLDQIGEEHFASYLKLLGISRRAVRPASCLVQMEPEDDLLLVDGTKFYAQDLVFEIDGAKQLVKDDISSCLSAANEKNVRKWKRQEWQFGAMGGSFYVFGEAPECGMDFYMKTASPLPDGQKLSLYMAIAKEAELKRTPIAGREDEAGSGFVPFVKLALSYFSEGSWKPVADAADGTHGLLEDGFFTFSLPGAMEQTEVFGETGYFLRLTYEDGLFDIPPRIAGISMNIATAVQRDTRIESVYLKGDRESVTLATALADYGINRLFRRDGDRFVPVTVSRKELLYGENAVRLFVDGDTADSKEASYLAVNMEWEERDTHALAVGNGFPEQEIELPDTGVLPERLVLLIEDEMEPRTFRLWTWVGDFGASGPEDRVFTFDSETNTIRFGDGIRGMAPEGQILLASLSVTAGTRGNIKTGRVNRIAGTGMEGTVISNITDGTGGTDRQSYRECFLQARRMMKHPRTAVTARDVEERIKKTPGLLLEAVKVLPVEEVQRFTKHASELDFHTMIRPYGHKKGMPLHPGYETNIRRYMEEYRPIGSSIVLYLPDYVEIELFVDAAAKPEYRHLERLLEEDLRGYFDRFADVFGSVIVYGSLYGWLAERPYIHRVRSLDIAVKGTGAVQSEEGDIILSPNGIAVLGRIRHALSMV